MNKEDLLQQLTRLLESGELTQQEVMQAIAAQEPYDTSSTDQTSRLSAVLFFIGGGVVFLGMVFLIAQEWNHFGTGTKIAVTLGSGLAAFASGVLFSLQQRLGAAGPAFFLISGLLLPGGVFVSYDEAGVDVGDIATQIQIAAILFMAYLGGYLVLRKNILLVFALIFGSWLFFAVTNQMVSGAPTIDDSQFINYRILFSGLAFMFLGYSFVGSERKALTSWLYAIGVLAFLGAGFALGEWKPSQNVFWEAVYPGLVFGIIFLSTHLKSRILLIFASLALGAFLIKITAEYFEDSLGWAFSLVIIGFMLMGVAYLAVRVNQRYVSQ